MSNDPRPKRYCDNGTCSLSAIKVHTRIELCLSCNRPLRDAGNPMSDIFGNDFNLGNLFGKGK